MAPRTRKLPDPSARTAVRKGRIIGIAPCTTPRFGLATIRSGACALEGGPDNRSGIIDGLCFYRCDASWEDEFATGFCRAIRITRGKICPSLFGSRNSSTRPSATRSNRNEWPLDTIRSPSRYNLPFKIAARLDLPSMVPVSVKRSASDRATAPCDPLNSIVVGSLNERGSAGNECDGSEAMETGSSEAAALPPPTVARNSGGIQKTRPRTNSRIKAARFVQGALLSIIPNSDVGPLPTGFHPYPQCQGQSCEESMIAKARFHLLFRQRFRRKLRQIPQVEPNRTDRT